MVRGQVTIFVVFAILAVCASSQFISAPDIDPNLLAATNHAISSLKGILTVYNCNSNRNNLFNIPRGGYNYSPQLYVFYSSTVQVIHDLSLIIEILKANNLVSGDNNTVKGSNNLVIGSNNIVKGDRSWVFADNEEVNGDSMLVIGDYQINLNNINQLLYSPRSVIRCLNVTQISAYFKLLNLPNNLKVLPNVVNIISNSKNTLRMLL